MTVVPEGSLILVTGATSFIATHTINELIRRRFRVRGTVRSAEKGELLKTLFKDVSNKAGGDKFEYVVVEDLQKEGGFTEAVQGVQGILHMASPLYRDCPEDTWGQIIEPARKGTTGIMRAAVDHGKDVKRIVITSSMSAAADVSLGPGAIFTEANWNTPVKQLALAKGKELDPLHAYMASKTWAEEAAWEFMTAENPSYDLTTIILPLVCGSAIHPVLVGSSLNTNSIVLWGYLTGSSDFTPDSAKKTPRIPVVDVKDVAKAHVESLLRPAASNKRINVSEGNHTYQEMLDIAQWRVPALLEAFPNANWGEPGATNDYIPYGLDATLSKEVFGMEYTSLEGYIVDAVESLLRRKDELEGMQFYGNAY